MMLEQCTKDFKSLIKRMDLLRDYEHHTKEGQRSVSNILSKPSVSSQMVHNILPKSSVSSQSIVCSILSKSSVSSQ